MLDTIVQIVSLEYSVGSQQYADLHALTASGDVYRFDGRSWIFVASSPELRRPDNDA